MTEIEEIKRMIELKKQLIDLTKDEINSLLNKKSIIEALDGREETES